MRAPDGPAAGLPFEIGERGIGHKLRGIAGPYIDFSDDQIRRCLSKIFRRVPREIRAPWAVVSEATEV